MSQSELSEPASNDLQHRKFRKGPDVSDGYLYCEAMDGKFYKIDLDKIIGRTVYFASAENYSLKGKDIRREITRQMFANGKITPLMNLSN